MNRSDADLLAELGDELQKVLARFAARLRERAAAEEKAREKAAAEERARRADPPAQAAPASSPTHGKLTPKETAARMRVTLATLANWRCRGKGPPYFKMGSVILYDAADVDAYLAGSKVQTTGERS